MISQRARKANKILIALHECSVVLDTQRVLDNVTYTLRKGEHWALLGANGSGKTLLLKLLRGDKWPTPIGRERREYHFAGEVSESPIDAKSCIAYVGPERQDKYVRYGWNHTVEQIVATGFFDEEIPRTQPSATQRRRVVALLKQFKLWSLRARGFLTLSYGQRRRPLVARAFASDPTVLLLDEVFNGLDAMSSAILRKSLHARGANLTWVVTTHRAQDIPNDVTNIATIKSGQLSVLDSARHDPKQWRELLKPSAKQGRLSLGPVAVKTRRRSSNERDALIVLRNVDLYRDYRRVLRDVNWTIALGEHWAILGRNGSGKSTLLKLLYGDLHPRLGGTIERAGMRVGVPIIQWKQQVGFVSPELQADYFHARDLEEVVMSGRYSSVGLNDDPTRADRVAAKRWLRFFGLTRFAHRKPTQISYGQMRLTLLARAMINRPRLLLLDEPCTGLDFETRSSMLRLLDKLARSGVQLVMAVHAREDLPSCVTRELLIEAGGKVRLI